MIANMLLQVFSTLPTKGFSSLWMEVTVLHLWTGWEPSEREPDAAGQVCRLLSCAPATYRRVN